MSQMSRFKMLANSLMVKRPSEQCQSVLQLLQKLSSASLHRFFECQRDHCWSETTVRDDVHPVMQEFNISSGYRHTGRTWRYYVRSAFQLHNETLNWLSHAIGSVLMLCLGVAWTLNLRPSADERDILLAWMFCVTSALLQAASSVAHLMHSRSEMWHCRVFFTDNAAVGLSGYANNLLSVAFFSSPGYYSWVGPITIPVLVFGAICLSASYSLALAAYRRRYNVATSLLMFGPSGCFLLFGMMPVIHRQMQMLPAADFLGVPHYSVFLLAVACYAAYFPERWWPGKFDLIGHSHQMFHCLVTASHSIMLSSVFLEIQRDSPRLFSKRPGDWITVQTAFRGLCVASVFSLAVVLLYARAFQYDREFVSKTARNKND